MSVVEYGSCFKQRQALLDKSHRNSRENIPWRSWSAVSTSRHIYFCLERTTNYVRDIGKHDFRSVLLHPMLPNTNLILRSALKGGAFYSQKTTTASRQYHDSWLKPKTSLYAVWGRYDYQCGLIIYLYFPRSVKTQTEKEIILLFSCSQFQKISFSKSVSRRQNETQMVLW